MVDQIIITFYQLTSGKKRGVLSFFQSKTSIAPMTNPGSKRFCMNGSAANSWIPFQSGVRGSRIDDSSLTKVSRRTLNSSFARCITTLNYAQVNLKVQSMNTPLISLRIHLKPYAP